ncbi:MAG: hypothetical protein D6706_06130 [Chloroflexi bacterium]|nr:MAG: hypothetical protein D6706_06130 [Chloroflexota bacterium]
MTNYDEFLFVDQEKKFRGFQKLLRPETRQAVMLIEAPKDMGKTWLLTKMARYCRETAVSLPVALVDFRNPREMHEIQDFLGLIRLIRNKLGFDSFFISLNRTINRFTASAMHHELTTGLATLRRNLETYFNLEEIKTLCFDLGINYENLPGSTLASKTRELVDYAQRYGRLSDLITLCQRERDAVNWWLGLEAWQNQSLQSEASDTADTYAPLLADSEADRQFAERAINNAFFESLAALLASHKPVVFLFDSYEAAPVEAERWFLDELFLRLRDEESLKDLVVVIAGRKTPDLTDLKMNHLVVQTGLDPFTEEYVREYFEERRKITGLDWHTVVLTSGGVPGALAMMADHALAVSQADDDFFSDV